MFDHLCNEEVLEIYRVGASEVYINNQQWRTRMPVHLHKKGGIGFVKFGRATNLHGGSLRSDDEPTHRLGTTV